MSPTPAIEARALCYDIEGVRLVDEVDLSIGAGELLGVVGPNGAGKTTLLRLLAGEVVPSRGEILLGARPLAEMAPRDLALARAVLPQHTLLQFAFRALDVVMMGRYPHGDATTSQDARVVGRAMGSTDTDQLATRLFPTLSGGEQTRVSFARVLAQQTRVVMLDEPTGSLDLRHQEIVMQTLKSLAADGAAVVAVLHDLNLAARHADRIAMMDRGRIVTVGPTSDVLSARRIETVYGQPVVVLHQPGLTHPVIVPIGG